MNMFTLALAKFPHGDDTDDSILPGEDTGEDEDTGGEDTDDRTPDKYQVPEAFKRDAGAIEAYAKEHKLTQEALDAGLNLVKGMSDQSIQARESKREAEQKELKKSWGADFDRHLEIAKKAVKDIDRAAGGELVKYLEETGAHTEPRLMRILFAAGRMMNSEGKGRKSRESKTGSGKKTGWDIPVEQALAASYKKSQKEGGR